MTTHTRPHTGRPATPAATGRYLIRDHTVIGTADQLTNVVTNHRNAGTLVAVATPRPAPGNRLQVVIRLREPIQTTPGIRVNHTGDHARTRAKRSRRTRIAVIVTTISGIAAGLVAVAAYLIGQLVELIAANTALLLGVLALAAILAVAAARRSSSGRRHCPGC